MSTAPQPSASSRETIDDIVLLDLSADAKSAARDRADARLAEELNEGGAFRRIVKGIWKGTIAKDYYRQKYIRHAQEAIEQSQDILTHETGSVAEKNRAMLATIERFQSDYDEAIHGEAGEQKEVLGQASELSQVVKGLVESYANGSLNDESLNEEFTRTLQAYSETTGADLKGAGVVRLHNLLDVARQVKSAVTHGESLDAVMTEFNVISGEARTNVRSEAHYDKVEKAIDKLNKSKIGSLVGPETIVASVSIAASVLRVGSTRAIGAAARTASFGLAGGLLAGLRERKRVKDDRNQHAREMAQGKVFEAGSKRRDQMEETRYQTAAATDLTDELNQLSSAETLATASDDAVRAALDAIVRVETLAKLSDRRSIDLVSYSDVAAVSEERFELDVARAEAKVALRNRLDDVTRRSLGLDAAAELDELIAERAGAFIETIDRDVSAKDAAFNRLRRRRVAGAAARGALIGTSIGLVAQEAGASLSDTRSGAVEQLWGAETKEFEGVEHRSLIRGLMDDEEIVTTTHHEASSEYVSYSFGEHGEISISDDHSMATNEDGTYSVLDSDGSVIIGSLVVNEDGSLPRSSIQVLRENGMSVQNITNVVTETRSVDVQRYIGSSQDTTTHVTRDLWYDNDTSAPNYDKNELGLWWGGDNNSGITSDGGYAFSVASMTSDGSYHGAESTNWAHQAENGNLQLAVSATKDTQAHVFMVDIKPNGEVIIPKGSPAEALFSQENGHAVFNGAYAEVVQVTGESDDVTHIRPLATVVGENNPGKIPIETEVTHPAYKITTDDFETTTETPVFTEMAPVIPVDSRRSLEAVAKKHGGNYYYGYNAEVSDADRRVMRAEQSPRLRADSDAQLNTREEIDWYYTQMAARRGSDVARLENHIDQSDVIRQLPQNFNTIVTLPVAAPMESDNIYKTLSLYGQQDKEALDTSLIVLNLNWLNTALDDASMVANIDKTRSEIERARQDFPNLNIEVFENEYNQAEVTKTGGVIGYVARDLMEAALMVVRDKEHKGEIADDQEIMIQRHDVDMEGMSRHHLKKMQNAFEKTTHSDIFKGMTRFGVRSNERYPGFGIVTDLSNMLNTWATRSGDVHTGGANFAVRASTLAAVGGLGDITRYSGAGSDDVAVGKRIALARSPERVERRMYSAYSQGVRSQSVTASSTSSGAGASNGRKHLRVLQYVGGANVDTNPDRLLPFYLNGQWYQEAWGSDKKAFQAGAGGYAPRTAHKDIMENNKQDELGKRGISYARIEKNISSELSIVDGAMRQRALSVLFREAPGAYTLKETKDGELDFKFTKAGRQYLRKRIGRQGQEYFTRKFTGLYRTNPLNKQAALVSPIG